MSPLEEVMTLQRDWGDRVQFIVTPKWPDTPPDFIGEVIPSHPTLDVPETADHSEISDSISRGLWGDGDFAFKGTFNTKRCLAI